MYNTSIRFDKMRIICIGLIFFFLKVKVCLIIYKLFSPNDYEKNEKIILNYFHNGKDEKIVLRSLW